MAENQADVPRNRFQIIGQLGRGALAEVYLCKLRGVAGFEKEVVVKRISSEYAADPLFVRMFLDEARVAARLTHPNIVQVFEVGEEEGVPYIAMEYVRGVTLGMVIRRAHQDGKVHYGHFAAIIAKVCDALAYAHSAVDQDGEPVGLVHRDVSPANIVINLDGNPKLLDFGMAAAKDRLLHTQDGMLTGELRYMAPEQVSRGRLDHRADVFSLGITLYELTTGINPFGPEGQGEAEVLDKVLNAPIPRPTQLVPSYPPTLEKIVQSAIERNVDKRCPSAREFRERLEVFAIKKEHLSTPRSLAAWLRDLFPDFTSLTRASEVTAPRPFPTAGGVPVTVSSLRGPTSGSMEAVTSPLAPPGRPLSSPLLQTGSSGASMWKWAAFGATGVAIAVAVWAFTRAPAPMVPPLSSAPPSAAPDGDAEAKVYIEAAEVFTGERRFEAALEMANKATAIPIRSKSLSARLTSLLRRIAAEQASARPAPAEKVASAESGKAAPAREPGAGAGQPPAAAAERTAPAGSPARGGAGKAPSEPLAGRAGEGKAPSERAGRAGEGNVPPSDPSKLTGRSATPGPTAGSSPQPGGVREGMGGFRVRQPLPRTGPRRLAIDGPRGRAHPPVWTDPRASGPRNEPGAPGRRPGGVETPPPGRRAAADLPGSGRPPGAPDSPESRRAGADLPAPGRSPVAAEAPARPAPSAAAPAAPAGEPAPPREAPAPLAKTETATPPAPPAGLVPARREMAPSSGGHALSAQPKDPIPLPILPREQIVQDSEQLARVCLAVEGATITQAGVSAEFAHGITGPFRKRVRPGSAVYPIAMYYFIVREAGLGHDGSTAANNLANAHTGGILHGMRNLAGVERPL